MDIYLARLPIALSNLDQLLKARGYDGHPCAGKPVIELLRACVKRACSLGSLLSCTLESSSSSSSLHVGWIDPVFDISKGREVMTSAYQLHGATAKGHKSLLISYAKLSPDALKECASLKNVQILTFPQLAIQISNHVLIPKHVALDEASARIFEKVRNISRSQLPLLRADDPVVLWNDWPKGTIVRIERPQGAYWRVVA